MSDTGTIEPTGVEGDGDRLIEEGGALPGADSPAEGEAFFELSRLMVAALFFDGDTGSIKTRAQASPNGPWEPDWIPVPGATGLNTMAAGATPDGRVALIGQTESGVLFIDEAGDGTGDASWNSPLNLGLPGGKQTTQLALGVDVQGLLTLVACSSQDASVWVKRRNPPRIVTRKETVTPPGSDTPIEVEVQVEEPADPPWADWTQVGSGPTHIEVVNAANGALAIFGYNKAGDGAQYGVLMQTLDPNTAEVGWSEYHRFPQSFATGSFPAAGLDTDGALNLFIASDFEVWQLWQEPAGAQTWTDWMRPGVFTNKVTAPVVGIDGHGHMVVLAKDYSSGQHLIYADQLEDAEHQAWRGFNAVASGAPPGARVAMNYNADGRLTYFSHDGSSPGALMCLDQAAVDSTSWTASWTLLGVGMREFAVVRDLTPPAQS